MPSGIGLRTLLPPDLVNSVIDTGEGFVTVDLAADAFARIDPADQRTAIAQIVLTSSGRSAAPASARCGSRSTVRRCASRAATTCRANPANRCRDRTTSRCSRRSSRRRP